MTERNRAEGWQHAKISGHRNEDLVTDLVMKNRNVQEELLRCAGMTGKIVDVAEGGLNETGIPSVLEGTTKAKPDIRLITDGNQHINISLKKSLGGQVYLVSADRFIRGFEAHYATTIPENVKRAIGLFWGSAPDTIDIVNNYAQNNISYQRRKHRVVKETLGNYDSSLPKALLDWIKKNIVEIFDFCFVRGLAKNEEDWANVIWYKNLLPGEDDGDTMFDLDDLRDKIKSNHSKVVYGTRTGGSTIRLPFGFVQWHQGQLQFHHSLAELESLYCKE